MIRFGAHLLAFTSLTLGLLAPARGSAASLTQVNRSEWAGSVKLPSYVQMYIYVPDRLAAKPPIMVSSHSCGSTATGQMGNITKIKAAADAQGFILILPDNPGQNCWDVGTSASLKHDGGGDTQAVVQMVKYTLDKYKGDAARVYAMGGSSGAMMTQALMAVYPDVFRAGHARAGVPAGCWADGYASSNQWSDNCANGTTSKTAQAWGDLVRGMYSVYTGHRPRLQIMQGQSDTTISYKNTAESIKEWTNVFDLNATPTSTDKGYKAAGASYDRQFWKNSCGFTIFEAWSSPGGTHSMPYEEAEILKFFGLDTASTSDPETDCSGNGGVTGSGGAGTGSGMGGTGGKSSGGNGPMGSGGASGGSSSTSGGNGSGNGTGGSGTGGNTNVGNGGSSGGSTGNGGSSGGSTGTGGSQNGGNGNGNGTGGTSTTSSGGAISHEPLDRSSGCGCIVGKTSSKPKHFAVLAAGLALLTFRRKRRKV